MPLEVAAEKLNLSPERLAAYEDPDNAELPTIKQLRRIAALYRKPTAFFYLETLPDAPATPHDYRQLPGSTGAPTHEILDAVFVASQRREDAIRLMGLLGEQIPDFPVLVRGERPRPDELGRQIRDVLGISIEQQRSWRGDRYRALRSWTDAAERAGVLVGQFSQVPESQGLGFSLPTRPLPVVSLNGSDPWPQRKIFTLMHELAHVSFGESAVCSPDRVPQREGNQDARLERYCNAVAAEVLMPHESLLANPSVLVSMRNGDWRDAEIEAICRDFTVSYEALLVRLVDLDLMTQARFDRWKDTHQIENGNAAGFLAWPLRYVRDNGRRFTTLVLRAYANELVTSPDVSRLLGSIKLSHLPEMRGYL